MKGSSQQQLPRSLIALSGLLVALIALVMAVAAGFGSRWGWWHFGVGFSVLRWAVYVAIAAVIVSLSGAVLCWRGSVRRGLIMAVVALVISLPVIIVPQLWKHTAHLVPPIHDITTDVVNPPQFVSILALRADAPNSVQYGGDIIAAKQQTAYPDIKPVFVAAAPAIAFDAALHTAKEMGWNIVAKDPSQGRIEATDTTFWFGFTDDVVIRMMPMDSGARLDLRSVSRVGVSDVGTNAARIRNFVKQFNQVIKQKLPSTNS